MKTHGQFWVHLLFGSAITATLTTGVVGWVTFGSFESLLSLQTRSQETVRLQGLINQYDEVLTMSARMAAATGEVQWENRYKTFEPLLDKAIKELVVLQPPGIESAKEVDEANQKLIAMESQAFELVRGGQNKQAVETLFSQEYQNQKEFYAKGVSEFNAKVNSSLAKKLESHNQRSRALKGVLLGLVLFTFAGWIFVYQRVRQRHLELSNSNEKLDQLVSAQATQLVNSAKMSALGEMAGGIAHEINNPLAVILGKASQLERFSKKGKLSEETLYESLAVITKTGQRIASIIRGLKSFARDGSKDPFLPVPLKTILEDSISICIDRMKSHNIKFETESLNFEAMIDCRAVQVSQVIINLLSNSMDAIDHLSEKWIKLSIRALDDNTVLIKVRDSGHGIPNDVVEKMMNPFFTTKAVGKGTGLGLSISLGIIDEHKGKLYYQLVDNHTEFVIELPMKAQPLVPVKESA